MNNTPHEKYECYALANYLDVLVSQGHVLCFSHIPNSTPTKRIVSRWSNGQPVWQMGHKTNAHNKRMGVHAGVPDYVIVMPTRTVFIEMKRVKGSTLKPNQDKWIRCLNNGASEAYLCYGFDEAKNLLDGIILTEQSK